MAPEAEVQSRADELRGRVDALRWYHTLELAPGVVTDGFFDHRPYVDRYGLPDDLEGLRALDVGAQDGFWSFELERRGAEVVALDVDGPEQLDWPPRLRERGLRRDAEGFPLADPAAFALAHETLGSSVERVGLSVYDATPERLGAFDLVLAGSVLIHLRDPLLALERLASVCRGRVVLVEEYSRRVEWVPRLTLAEFTGEWPWMTWWRPSSRAWVSMVHCAGFDDVEVRSRFKMKLRGERASVAHVVVHARRGQ